MDSFTHIQQATIFEKQILLTIIGRKSFLFLFMSSLNSLMFSVRFIKRSDRVITVHQWHHSSYFSHLTRISIILFIEMIWNYSLISFYHHQVYNVWSLQFFFWQSTSSIACVTAFCLFEWWRECYNSATCSKKTIFKYIINSSKVSTNSSSFYCWFEHTLLWLSISIEIVGAVNISIGWLLMDVCWIFFEKDYY